MPEKLASLDGWLAGNAWTARLTVQPWSTSRGGQHWRYSNDVNTCTMPAVAGAQFIQPDTRVVVM